MVFASMFAVGRSWSFLIGQSSAFLQGLLWFFLAVFYLVPVFSIQGRSGYLLALLGGIFWVVFGLFKLRGRTRFLAPFLAIVVLGALVYTSPHFFKRSYQAVDDVVRYSQTGEQTSQGERIRFWRAGLTLAVERPLIGYGAGGYAQAYSELKSEPESLRSSRSQPHSEYVIVLVQGGVVGLVLLTALLVLSIRGVCRPHDMQDDAGILCVTILFVIYAGFNSAIWDLAEGHLFSLLAAVALIQSFPMSVCSVLRWRKLGPL